MLLQGTFRRFAIRFGDLCFIGDADFCDLDRLFDLLYITLDMGNEIVGKYNNLTRCQRAGKSAAQSSRDGGDHVVQRGGYVLGGFDAVKLRDAAMHAVGHGFVKAFEIAATQRRYFLNNFGTTYMHNFTHSGSPC